MARTNSQWKVGGTYIQTIDPNGYDILINGSNRYLNFNTTSGVSGYGIRDNAGVLEFKNSGGAWSSLANLFSAINPALAVQAATTANVTGYTYNNGTAGVGATLTQNVASAVIIDGYTLLLNDRVLFKNQATGSTNGIYVLTTLGTGVVPAVFTRATDYNTPSNINNSSAIPVINGTANALTSWLQTATITTVGTDSLIYSQFSVNPSISNISGLTTGQLPIAGSATTLTSSIAYTASNTPSTIVSRDVNGNAAFVNVIATNTLVATSGQIVNLTAASQQGQIATGVANITFNLPDATTCYLGQTYTFDNDSTGTITVNLKDGTTLLTTTPAGGYTTVICSANGTINGSWHAYHSIPDTTNNWGTAGMKTGSQITSTLATGTAPFVVASTTPVANLSIGGNAATVTGLSVTAGKTLTASNSLTLAGTDGTTMTFPTTSATIARTDAANTFTGVQTFTQVITTANAITATANAATIPVTSKNNIVTNNSAAAITITLATAGAVNMQPVIVQILDFSAVAQTLTFVNTENSTVTVPATTNGSTTLPLTVGFVYNTATSKWRCVASA